MLVVEQSEQQPLPDPQSELEVPGWQFPLESQQPGQVPLPHELPELPILQVAASALLAASILASNAASMGGGASTPVSALASTPESACALAQ
jgi:hypothetical protein